MEPKYVAGNKVRIKAHDLPWKVLDPNLQSFENMVGEILDSENIVAFISEPWAPTGGSGKRITIYYYTVRIDERVTLHNVTEDFLEQIN
jgi:hypothetical protein